MEPSLDAREPGEFKKTTAGESGNHGTVSDGLGGAGFITLFGGADLTRVGSATRGRSSSELSALCLAPSAVDVP